MNQESPKSFENQLEQIHRIDELKEYIKNNSPEEEATRYIAQIDEALDNALNDIRKGSINAGARLEATFHLMKAGEYSEKAEELIRKALEDDENGN